MNEAATRPDRLARFREAAGKMEEALREEGFDEHGSHAIFVRWQRELVEGLGGILLEAEKKMGERVETACARIEEASRRFRDDEFRRAELLLTSGQEALNMARQAQPRRRPRAIAPNRSSTPRWRRSRGTCR